MKEIIGNLITMALQHKFDVIVHGCNCFCIMGAGIARQIKEIFPEAYLADRKTTPGDIKKLGCYSRAKSSPQLGNITVINAYTQYNYNKYSTAIVYIAVKKVFEKINQDFKGKKIGIPKIGTGLAGGDWKQISNIIEKATPDLDITVVKPK